MIRTGSVDLSMLYLGRSWVYMQSLTRAALSQVNRLLAQRDGPYPYPLEACAAVLLLCLTELCDGTSRVWKWHLKAAGTLLASTPTAEPQAGAEATAEGAFCRALFHYLDSMSTISRCKPPLLHKVQGNSGNGLAELIATTTDSSAELQPTNTSPADLISGMAPALLDLLGMVNLLAAHCSRRVDELSDLGFRTAAAQVQARLDSWRATYDESVVGPVNNSNETSAAHANSATTAFKWAVRLRLYQIIDGYDPHYAAVEIVLE